MENSASIEETIASIRSYWRNGRCAEVAHVELLIAEIERLTAGQSERVAATDEQIQGWADRYGERGVSCSFEDAQTLIQSIPAAAAVPDIKTMVDRFLGWPLPEKFSPDCGITYTPIIYNGKIVSRPIGTNLLNADQAKAMFEYVLAASPEQRGAG